MADLMFRKQDYEAAINLYHQVLEKMPGKLPARSLPTETAQVSSLRARAALSRVGEGWEKGGSPLLPGWAEEAPSSLIVPREAGN